MEGQTTATEKGKTIADASVDTMLIYDRLMKAEVGDVIGYGELTELIRRDVQGRGRHFMESARNMAMRENRMVFDCVRTVGLKRLDDIGIVGTGTGTLKKIRLAARRGARKLSSVKKFDDMPHDARVRHNALVSTLGAVAHFAKEVIVKKIEGHMEETQVKLGAQKTLELFRS